MARRRRHSKKSHRRRRRNPGLPWFWLSVLGIGGFLLWRNYAKGKTLAEIGGVVLARMKGQAQAVQALEQPDGTVVVQGIYNGQPNYVFFTGKNAQDALNLANLLEPGSGAAGW